MSGLTGGGVKAATLARALNLSRQRVSQLVAEGRLEGSYSGAGRDRRFDVLRAAQLLDVKLDPGQVMGNGAISAAARRDLLSGRPPERQPDRRPTASAAPPSAEEAGTSRYQQARAEQAEIDTLLKRRRLAEEEGRWVLASEVDRMVRARMAAELALVDSMLRDGARRLADELAVDYRAAKALLTEEWRRHRARRSDELRASATDAAPSEAEIGEDISAARSE